jgi:hypothetical protein
VLIVAAILIGYDVWWAVLLVPVAALAFYASYRFPSSSPGDRESVRREVTTLATVSPGGVDCA